MDEAKRALSEGDRFWPYFTICSVYPEELFSPVYVQHLRNYQAALRLAGGRDHACDDADIGVPFDGSLHSESVGHTPVNAPGAQTIGTTEAQDRLRRKMAELTAGDLNRPVVAVGWNSERFDGRNLALRLAALGYTQVFGIAVEGSLGGRSAT
jgi:hypothetical protein